MSDEFEPYLKLFCLDGQAEHQAAFTDSLTDRDVERVARDHVNLCDGCSLCTRGGVWHEVRRNLNADYFDYIYR